MAVVLYRIGESCEIDGWKCDRQLFDPELINFEARFREGWHLKPDCGRSKDDGMQPETQWNVEEKTKKSKKKKILSKKEIVEISLEHFEEIEKNKKELDKLTFQRLRSVARRKGLNSSRMNKKELKEYLLKQMYGVEDDLQDRSDKQCIQPAENQRSDDNESKSC